MNIDKASLEKLGYSVRKKTLLDVADEKGKPLFTVFPDDQYIQFHDEFTQIGVELPGMAEAIEYGWNCNHT